MEYGIADMYSKGRFVYIDTPSYGATVKLAQMLNASI